MEYHYYWWYLLEGIPSKGFLDFCKVRRIQAVTQITPTLVVLLLGWESISVEFAKSARQEHRGSLYIVYLEFENYFLSGTVGSQAETEGENSTIYWEISPYPNISRIPTIFADLCVPNIFHPSIKKPRSRLSPQSNTLHITSFQLLITS